jgi:hypothetical protein
VALLECSLGEDDLDEALIGTAEMSVEHTAGAQARHKLIWEVLAGAPDDDDDVPQPVVRALWPRKVSCSTAMTDSSVPACHRC